MLNLPESVQVETLKIPQVQFPNNQSRNSTNASSTPSFHFAVKGHLTRNSSQNAQFESKVRFEDNLIDNNPERPFKKTGRMHKSNVLIELPKMDKRTHFSELASLSPSVVNLSNGFLKVKKNFENDDLVMGRDFEESRDVSIVEYFRTESESEENLGTHRVSVAAAEENKNSQNPTSTARNSLRTGKLNIRGIHNLVFPKITAKKTLICRFEIILNSTSLKMPKIKRPVKDCCWAFCF